MKEDDYAEIDGNVCKFMPDLELRFIIKHLPAPHLGPGIAESKRVLQQRWVAKKIIPGAMLTKHQWRDIPLVLDETE